MLKIVIFRLEGSKLQKKCPDRIGTGSYSSGTTEKREIFNQKNDPKKAKIWSWCVFFLILCRVPILSGQLEFWGFRLLFWLCWGGRPGIGPKWANMVQNTTKVVIFAIVWGQTWPSSSYSGWSGAYSIGTPCMYAFLNSNGSRGKPGTSAPAGRSWRHSRASRPGPATLHTSTNQVATVLAHKCDITTLSNYLESNPLIFLGFFFRAWTTWFTGTRPPFSQLLLSLLLSIVERSLQTRQPLRSTKRLRSHSYYHFAKILRASGASKQGSLQSLEENSTFGCRANKIPGKNSTFGCRANKILGVAVSYS